MEYMGRGRTHAVGTWSLNRNSVDELEQHIKESVSTRMNLGLTYDELEQVDDMIDRRQVTRRSDINVKCEKDGSMAECLVAVDYIPW